MTNSLGLTYSAGSSVPCSVVVDRLQDRLAVAQQAQMLLEDVDIVRARVERRQARRGARLAVVAVIVVSADHRAVFLAQNLGDARRQRRLSRRRITDDAEDDRMIDPLRHFALQALLPSSGVQATSRAAMLAMRSLGM